MKHSRSFSNIIFFGGLVLLFLLLSISSKYVDWLWFKSLGTTTVFWVTLITGPLTKLLIGLVLLVFFASNLLLALRAFNRPQVVNEQSLWPDLSARTLRWPGLAVVGFLTFFLTSGLALDWATIQQFLNQIPVGTVDPFFRRDLGFYLFSYPFYKKLINLLQISTFLGLLGTGLIYFLAKAWWREGRNWEVWRPAQLHLTILAILFLTAKIWSYNLAKYGLLFKDSSRLTGIGYSAAHAKIAALIILIWIVVAIILLLIISLFRKRGNILVWGLGIWLGSSLLIGGIYPGIVQALVVAPNEYVLEAPYLKNHISATRQAYGLEQIKAQPFLPAENRSANLNPANPALADLRLWDYRPLVPSYNQLQSIRSYYQFNDIDIDRYPSLTGQHQVMIAARELEVNRLDPQAQSWINLHLSYTHGYGFAANQVNQFSSQGQPIFIARDLPPQTDPRFPGLALTRPEIYFGESTNQYLIVDTKNAEFDYPKGETNVFTKYNGNKGIPLNSFFRKIMLFKYGGPNLLISPQLTKESSLLLHRQISDRVHKLAPFLSLDSDPYLVAAGGKLYWIIDAYTASSYYPYSKYHDSGVNYLRNSVKVVVDAYNGSVDFYQIDPADPLLQVWQKIFPQLFKPLSALNPDLVRHFRYPQHLMEVQRDLLLQYHMTNTRTFYEKEDYWEVPLTQGENEPFEPYYVTLKLPGQPNTEFVMLQPFTPRGKQNLISWLVARCDQPNYGKLVLYNLPKDQNIYGPGQIESRINQDQTISSLITLWNQQHSRITWGKLLIIPIDQSILYVKTLFLESEQGQQAELKKVVVVYQNQVLIGDTLAEALGRYSFNPSAPTIFQSEKNPKTGANRKAEIIKRIEELIKEEQKLLDELRRY